MMNPVLLWFSGAATGAVMAFGLMRKQKQRVKFSPLPKKDFKGGFVTLKTNDETAKGFRVDPKATERLRQWEESDELNDYLPPSMP